ncbi:MAG: TIGR00645 family protein [Methanosphaera stadtmanae]|nr:TIGR00645 family protein [Methanosphaera stadtmanae]
MDDSDKKEEKSNFEKIEDLTERALFGGRWFLAPVFLGLIVVLFAILIKFIMMLIAFIPNIFTFSFDEITMNVLNILDLSLLGNLVLIVTFSGYENFVSKIDIAQKHVDRPSWMGNLDFSGLKLKIIGSVVAISLIELLKDFLEVASLDPNIIFWRIMLHLTFVFSGLIFAIMEYVADKRETE